MSDVVEVDVGLCTQCGGRHGVQAWKRHEGLTNGATHFATCPVTRGYVYLFDRQVAQEMAAWVAANRELADAWVKSRALRAVQFAPDNGEVVS